jgi:hypothetical protein
MQSLCSFNTKPPEHATNIVDRGPHFHKGVPKITVILGTRDPQNTGKMGTRVPIFPVKWGPGVPVLGGPHFNLTPGLSL